MTFWGELTDGTELLLGEPMEAQLLYDSDAPASQLRAVFPAEKQWEDLAVVRVFHQGQVAFGGIVDEQNTALSGEGFTVELIARSWEALLLDNEARPAVLRSPSFGPFVGAVFPAPGPDLCGGGPVPQGRGAGGGEGHQLLGAAGEFLPGLPGHSALGGRQGHPPLRGSPRKPR